MAPIPFTWTRYYSDELGDPPWRAFVTYEDLIDREALVDIKHFTNDLEQELAPWTSGVRKINLDPGYMTLGQFFLATTKDQRHRVYIRDGIFVEPTLYFQDGDFFPFEWTYRDYRSEEYRAYFLAARSKFAYQMHHQGIPYSRRKATGGNGKPGTAKAPGLQTRERGLEDFVTGLARADTQRAFDLEHENLSVADFAGAALFGNGGNRPFHQLIRHDHFQLHLGDEVGMVFAAAVELGMAFLASEPFHLGHGHAGDAHFLDCGFHFVQLERFDVSDDHLHMWSPLPPINILSTQIRRRCRQRLFIIVNGLKNTLLPTQIHQSPCQFESFQ